MDEHAAIAAKICSRDRLLALRERARALGETIVHCHGCFDIVHPGHVRHLRYASTQGTRLLVSITSDRHVNKGEGRPVFSEWLRAENLAALSCVDWVYLNPDPTATGLLEWLRPDVYVKGAEYEANRDPRFEAERLAVEGAGGRVVFSSGDVVFSSTALVDELRQQPTGDPVARFARDHDCSIETVSEALDRMRGRSITVIGETIIDSYVTCDWPNVASESPTLTLRPVHGTSYDGGAAIIARHLAALGARPSLVTVLPDSGRADELVDRLNGEGIDVLPIHAGEDITEKQRYLVGRDKLVKLDHVADVTLDSVRRAELLDTVLEATRTADAAIIADYGLGMFSPRTTEDLATALANRVPVLAGDVSGRRSTLLSMVQAHFLCPSEAELRLAMHDYDSSLPRVVWELMESTGARSVAVTLGADGVTLFRRADTMHGDDADSWSNRLTSAHLPALTAEAVDSLGCGDALLAAATLARAAGIPPTQALFLGALAAAVEAASVGNVPASRAAVMQVARRVLPSHGAPASRTHAVLPVAARVTANA